MKKGTLVAGCGALLAALLSVACGGGGGSGNGTGGIDRGGVTIAVGPVSGFGSIFVNGVEYSTSGATVSVDDQPGTESDLRVGQIVRVEGTVNANGTTGTATKVTFDDELEGPIQSIDLARNQMVILGQTVQVGPGTSFDEGISPASLEGLAAGQRVEISGTVTSTGVVNASRVELKASASGVELKGKVASLDTGNKRFSINQQQIDYSGASLSGFGGGQPVAGDNVEVKGTVNGSNVLVATSVDKESGGASGGSNDKGDFEGLVTRFASATDFDVAGQRVTTTASTTYSNGTSANLALDVKVEVEGAFDSSGRLVAAKVDFRQDASIEIEARVDSVNAAGNSLVVLGVTIRTNALTRLEDKSSAGVQRFSLANLSPGDYVSIHAYDSGGLIATQLERENAFSRYELRGPTAGLANPSFTVAGIAVTSDANTEFRDVSGATITASAFFALPAGQTVKVRGTLINNTILAERVEIED
jgi:hypothetical protein